MWCSDQTLFLTLTWQMLSFLCQQSLLTYNDPDSFIHWFLYALLVRIWARAGHSLVDRTTPKSRNRSLRHPNWFRRGDHNKEPILITLQQQATRSTLGCEIRSRRAMATRQHERGEGELQSPSQELSGSCIWSSRAYPMQDDECGAQREGARRSALQRWEKGGRKASCVKGGEDTTFWKSLIDKSCSVRIVNKHACFFSIGCCVIGDLGVFFSFIVLYISGGDRPSKGIKVV